MAIPLLICNRRVQRNGSNDVANMFSDRCHSFPQKTSSKRHSCFGRMTALSYLGHSFLCSFVGLHVQFSIEFPFFLERLRESFLKRGTPKKKKKCGDVCRSIRCGTAEVRHDLASRIVREIAPTFYHSIVRDAYEVGDTALLVRESREH